MAHTDSAPNDLVKIGPDGMVGLHKSTPNYRAWERWMRTEFRKHFFPEWITVLGEWPPITQSTANAVASWLSDIRDGKYQKEQTLIGGLAVPRHPQPWDGYVPPAPKGDSRSAAGLKE